MGVPLAITNGVQKRLDATEYLELPGTNGIKFFDGLWSRYLAPDPTWKGADVYHVLPYDSGTLALASQLPGGSATPSIAAGRVYASPATSTGAPTFRELASTDVGPALPPDYISGFQIAVSTTVVTVGAGILKTGSGAYVEFAGGTNSETRALNSTYHLYVNTSGTLSRSTTAPEVYFGSARSRGASTTLRYIGSVRTDASGNYRPYVTDFGTSQVRAYFAFNTGTDGRVIAGGTATSATSVSAAAWVYGTTANALMLRAFTTGTAGALTRLYTYASGAHVLYTNVASNGIASAPQPLTLDLPCDNTPNIRYDAPSGASGPAWVDLFGFTFSR